MKILLAPDKFKDTLSALEVCEALAVGITKFDSSIEIVCHPLADGGEGTLEVLQANLELEKVEVIVNDPLFRPIKTYYLKDSTAAFIEMAQASGLQRLDVQEYNPLETSTFGTGELIKHAIESGVKLINLFIGGSATNDGGIGLATALGCKFMPNDGTTLKPTGAVLSQITKIDDTGIKRLTRGVEFRVLTDVENELFGTNGAAFVYGKQKGANAEQIKVLDFGLKHLARTINNGKENIPGAGAAGGLGYGAMTFLNARLESGIDFILETANFNDCLSNSDLVITGEGRIDKQTFDGKVVDGVIKSAKEAGKPVVLLCGSSLLANDDFRVYQIIDLANDFEDAMENTSNYLQILGERIARDFIQSQTN